MNKKFLALLLTAVFILSLWGCAGQDQGTVYVENVGQIVEKGSIAVSDKFPGVVISEDRVEIRRDETQTIAAVHVEQGDMVNAGDMLFSYASDVLSLELSKMKLELEKLNNTVATLKAQIAQLQKEQKAAAKEDQLRYTIEIQDREAQLEEAEYNAKKKNEEIQRTNTALLNVNVTSPISGKVIAIDTADTGELNGAYMIIQQFGNYRIKGTVNELNINAIIPGAVVNVTARNNASLEWRGVVSSVDLESAQQQENPNPDSSMTTSSSYAFYVELDHSDGLMLGQHVYLELGGLVSENEGIWLPEYYICYDSEGTVFVWAESEKGLLERRPVTLGGYDDATYTVEIVNGLSEGDYIAFPESNCYTGAKTVREDGTVVKPSDKEETNAQDNMGEAEGDPDKEDPGQFDTKNPEEGSNAQFEGQEGELIDPDQLGGGDSGLKEPSSDGDLGSVDVATDGDLGG